MVYLELIIWVIFIYVVTIMVITWHILLVENGKENLAR
jgi:hypothetical protein